MVLTGQHREMVAQVMDLFGLEADCDLGLMAPRQTLTHVTCAALQGLRDDFQAYPPAMVLVQGDTTTAFAAGLAAFYEQIPVGHVEAGLRTDNLFDPFPEEANRRLLSQIASLHFVDDQGRSQSEELWGDRVSVTGNTVIDALLQMAESAPAWTLKSSMATPAGGHGSPSGELGRSVAGDRGGHVAGAGEVSGGGAAASVAPQPHCPRAVAGAAGRAPAGHLDGTVGLRPTGAAMKVHLAAHRFGRLQEEAPALGKPVLVLRRTTERPEAEAGTARLVGTDPATIVEETLALGSAAYDAMSRAVNPFGDGQASQRILDLCRSHLGV